MPLNVVVLDGIDDRTRSVRRFYTHIQPKCIAMVEVEVSSAMREPRVCITTKKTSFRAFSILAQGNFNKFCDYVGKTKALRNVIDGGGGGGGCMKWSVA